jgi:hypothetical protein
MELCRAQALESHYSTPPQSVPSITKLEVVVHPSFKLYARKTFGALLCATAFFAAGCHNNNLNSGYGVAWVSLTGEPGGVSTNAAIAEDFTSYIVNVDSITLTRNDGVVVTALATPETVDFTQLKNIAELWGSGSVPNGTYLSASITIDYTSAVISVLVNGVPTTATVTNTSGSAVTTMAVTVTFDPLNPLVITPTYASTSAERLSINFDLAASGWVGSSSPPVVAVNPYFTVSVLPSDTKLTRIRGPLINTSAPLGTYTVYVRPFYDEVDNLGTLSLFSTPSTIYSINGNSYVGTAGVNALSLLSAGITMTAAYTTFTPDLNTANGAPAGTFYPVYVIGGSTLEDQYTEGVTGDVIARNGDTVTLRGSTLILNTANTTSYETADTQLLLGSGTLVTADGTTLSGLNSSSVAVGQHIQARGIYSILASLEVQLDATGTSATNTGSVRLQSSELWGPLVSSAAGGLTMNVQTINDWPVSIYNFSGNGATAAQNPLPSAFAVNTGALTVPAGTVAGDPLWVDGLFTPFGAVPPDFTAGAVNSETSVQVAGGSLTPAGTQTCGLGSQVCEPASLRVLYAYSLGTTAPFVAGLTNAGFAIDLTSPALQSAVIRIGPENIDLKSLPASPQFVPTTLPSTSTFSPLYSVGNPTTATVTPTVTSATSSIEVFSSFPSFVTAVNSTVSSSNPVVQIEARGVYNRATNTFTATTVNVVL